MLSANAERVRRWRALHPRKARLQTREAQRRFKQNTKQEQSETIRVRCPACEMTFDVTPETVVGKEEIKWSQHRRVETV